MKIFNPRISILMYHEISEDIISVSNSHDMTPLYDISLSMFERQMSYFAAEGYQSLLFEDIPDLKEDGKYVVITFDDGLKGNYKYALPILKKYCLKATFFVAVSSMGTERFMTWAELEELIRYGMSVQSHTMSHNPLQNLDDEDIYRELYESKRNIESRLQTKVAALSFPHGSFNIKTVRIARQVGYEILCTSNIDKVHLNDFLNKSAVLGRIAMTNKMDQRRFIRIVEYNKREIIKQKILKTAKNTFKHVIGIENYRKLYRRYFNINKS